MLHFWKIKRCSTKSMKNGALNVTRGCGEMGWGGESNGLDTGNETNLLSRLLCVLERGCGVKLINNSALLLLLFSLAITSVLTVSTHAMPSRNNLERTTQPPNIELTWHPSCFRYSPDTMFVQQCHGFIVRYPFSFSPM
jgi:hypothetical protein